MSEPAATAAPPVLAIAGLHVLLAGARGLPPRLVLADIGLDIAAGEVHGLVGESGAGKSMLTRAIFGILPRTATLGAGSIRFGGLDWLAMPAARRRQHLGRDLALVPQDPSTALNPARTIGSQVGDVLRLHFGLDARARHERAAAALAAVQIRAPERVLGQYPHELSGGMRQRVLIAIAFACRPRLIIADEPTTALDVTVQRDILRLLRTLQRQDGAAVLFVSHNLGVVSKLCDRASVIHGGRIVEQGAIGDLVARPGHPYTRALFAATPRHDRPADTLVPVDGAVIDALAAEARDYEARYLAGMG